MRDVVQRAPLGLGFAPLIERLALSLTPVACAVFFVQVSYIDKAP